MSRRPTMANFHVPLPDDGPITGLSLFPLFFQVVVAMERRPKYVRMYGY